MCGADEPAATWRQNGSLSAPHALQLRGLFRAMWPGGRAKCCFEHEWRLGPSRSFRFFPIGRQSGAEAWRRKWGSAVPPGVFPSVRGGVCSVDDRLAAVRPDALPSRQMHLYESMFLNGSCSATAAQGRRLVFRLTIQPFAAAGRIPLSACS